MLLMDVHINLFLVMKFVVYSKIGDIIVSNILNIDISWILGDTYLLNFSFCYILEWIGNMHFGYGHFAPSLTTSEFVGSLPSHGYSYIIYYNVGEPRIGSRVSVCGTFTYWFVIIRESIRRNTRTK
jgi:hypothetical protein